MIRFVAALLPHAITIVLCALVGAVLGLVLDVRLMFEAALGPGAAHIGHVVLILLAAIPVLFAATGALAGLGLSLVVCLGWDAYRRQWRRRTTVRSMTLFAGLYSWLDLLGGAPEGGWGAPHLVVLGLLSAAAALVGAVVGLLVAQFLPRRPKRPNEEISARVDPSILR